MLTSSNKSVNQLTLHREGSDVMKQPVCLITGATDGVGKVTAIALAKSGFTVVVAARSAQKAEALKKEIEASTGNTSTDFIVSDLASLRQVRLLAEED